MTDLAILGVIGLLLLALLPWFVVIVLLVGGVTSFVLFVSAAMRGMLR